MSALLAFVLLGFTGRREGVAVAENASPPPANEVGAIAGPPPAGRLDYEAIAAAEEQRLHDVANEAAFLAAENAAASAVANALIDQTTMTPMNSASGELPSVNGM
jgi:hypothetical protein